MRSSFGILGVVVAGLVAASCGGVAAMRASGTGGATGTGGTRATGTGGTGTGAAGTGGGTAAWKPTKVFVILMENHNWQDIKGSPSAPYINGLLATAAHCEQYFSPPGIHPSEPNYIWIEAGDNYGITTDNPPGTGSSENHVDTTSHLVTQLEAAGRTWKSYQEDISGTDCPLVAVNNYAPKHNAPVFFPDVTDGFSPTSQRCITHVRPYTELAADLAKDTVADYNFITPNLCDDMHNTCAPLSDQVKQGDTWLSTELPKILASKAYADGAVVFITWDENEAGNFPIGFIALSNGVKKGYASMGHYTHSSLLRTVQSIFGLQPFLKDAANANDLADLFATIP